MSEPDLSTLPKRMRYAADVLKEARKAHHSRPENGNSDWAAYAWDPTNLCYHADNWESEDSEAADRDAQIEELAQAMYQQIYSVSRFQFPWFQTVARNLVESGWRKGDPE